MLPRQMKGIYEATSTDEEGGQLWAGWRAFGHTMEQVLLGAVGDQHDSRLQRVGYLRLASGTDAAHRNPGRARRG